MSLALKLRDLVTGNPRDLAARGVYADALIQDGDPRGTFITLQAALDGRLSPDKREAARKQLRQLFSANEEKWLAPAKDWAEIRWKGGFMHAIRASAADFLVKGAALVAAEPVAEVTLTDTSNQEMAALADCAAIAKLHSLSITGNYKDASAAKLAASAHASKIASLNLSGGSLGSAFAQATANLRALQSLCATSMSMGDDPMEVLGKNLSAVQKLYLARNEITDEGVAALADGALGELRVLCLGGNEISDEGCAALAEAKLEKLRQLELNQTQITDEGAMALAKSKTLKSLKKLDIRQTEVSEAVPKLRKKGITVRASYSDY